MHRRVLAALVVVALPAQVRLSAQSPTPMLTAGAKALVQRYDTLPEVARSAVVRAVEERLRTCELPARLRLVEAAKATESAKTLRPRPFHDPATFAPVQPTRNSLLCHASHEV